MKTKNQRKRMKKSTLFNLDIFNAEIIEVDEYAKLGKKHSIFSAAYIEDRKSSSIIASPVEIK